MPAVGPRPISMLGSGDHACLSFANDVEQRELATGFVRNGLAGQEKVYYFADTDPIAVAESLQAGGVAAGTAVGTGQLVVLSTADAYLAGGSFDPEAMIPRLHQLIDAALAQGYARVRIAAEMSWAPGHGLNAEAIASYENAATTVFTSRPACALCQYDRRRFPPGMLAAAQAAHPQAATADPVYVDASVTLTAAYDPVGLRVAGEVDRTNSAAWQAAVTSAAGRGEEVHLDLSELEFIDLQGLRVLVRTAEGMADGSRLVLDSAPPQLVRMLRLTGWDRSPNLVVGASEWRHR